MIKVDGTIQQFFDNLVVGDTFRLRKPLGHPLHQRFYDAEESPDMGVPKLVRSTISRLLVSFSHCSNYFSKFAGVFCYGDRE